MKGILAAFGLFFALSSAPALADDLQMGCGPTSQANDHIHRIADGANAVVMKLDHEQSQTFLAFINKIPPESDIKAETVTLIVAQDLRSMSFFTTGDVTCGAVRLSPEMTQAAVNQAVGIKS